MLKKLKASLGLGAAKVDTILDDEFIYQGNKIQGVINIQGGDIDQQIDAIKLKLCTEVKIETESGGVTRDGFVLQNINANEPFIIKAEEEKSIPFSIALPDETPITAIKPRSNQSHVWLETSLDIDFAIDPSDRDYLNIQPLFPIAHAIKVLEREGYTFVKADVEKGYLRGKNFRSKSGCYQELEFQSSGFFDRKEIELSFVLDGNVIYCLSEIDRTLSTRGDSYRSFAVSRDATEAEIERALLTTLHS